MLRRSKIESARKPAPTITIKNVALIVATCALAAIGSPISATAAEPWEKLLQLQLESEFKCVLSGTVFVREMPSASGPIISGRAICHDARQFDFSQDKPHMKFEIRACEPMVC